MHRRIMVAIEFRQPDHLLRKRIWATHLPEQMKLADDVDLVSLTNSSTLCRVRVNYSFIVCCYRLSLH